MSSPTCSLQLQSSPSPYESGQFGDRITPLGPARSPPHRAETREAKHMQVKEVTAAEERFHRQVEQHTMMIGQFTRTN